MVGEHEGRHYLVMEYVEGVTLRDYLLRKGSLDVPVALSLMRQITCALQCAGELSIVHRDIKPENILLNRKGEAKVADFGLSRCLTLDQPIDLTRSGTTVGTPRYMSPEQIEGKAVDARSDIYSFGITSYEMLAGKPPFDGGSAFEIAMKHVRDEPTPLEKLRPDVPPGLLAIVNKMIAKNRHERYPSARELLQDIVRLRDTLGNTNASLPAVTTVIEAAPTEEFSEPAVPLWKRPAWLYGGIAAAVLAFLLVVLVIAWPRGEPANPVPDNGIAANPEQKPAAVNDEEENLKKTVERYLSKASPSPAGVEVCIDLAVLYLDHDKLHEAEALFKRRSAEHKPPSAYYFVGTLGRAVVDSINKDDAASKASPLRCTTSQSFFGSHQGAKISSPAELSTS